MDFTITKITTETYGVSGVDTPQQATDAFKAGKTTQIGQSETLNVQPRPVPGATMQQPIRLTG